MAAQQQERRKFVEPEEITCTVTSISYSKKSQYSEDKHFMILIVRQGNQGFKVLGEADPGSIITNCEYRMSGVWHDDPTFGRQFKFKSFVVREPNSRLGVTSYLEKFCVGVGDVVSGRICDKYGPDKAISTLRDDPERVSKECGLHIDRAKEASESLKSRSKSEETHVALLDLLKGRRFRKVLPDLLIKDFGPAAAKVVRENPFILIEKHYPGCGFLLVNEMYLALGHDPCAIKRQVYALVYSLERLGDGSTWGRYYHVYSEMGKLIDSGLKFQEAITEAVNLNKVRTKNVGPDIFIACKNHADTELMIAQRLIDIAGNSLIPGSTSAESSDSTKSLKPSESPKSQSEKDNPFADLFGDDQEDDQESNQEDDSQPQSGLKIENIIESAFGELEKTQQEHNAAPLFPSDDVRDIKPHPVKLPVQQDDDFGIEMEFTVKNAGLNENYDKATKLILRLDSLTERLQNHQADKCADFVAGVIESLAGISELVEKRKECSEKQFKALNTMIAGCERWVETEDQGDWEDNEVPF